MAAATLIQPPYKSLFCAARINQRISSMHNQRLSPFISSAIADNNLHVSSTANEPKNPYNDNWFDRLAINHLSQSLQSSTGLISKKKGYDSLVEAATMASQRFDTIQQRQLVIQTLEKAIPAPILYLIKTMLPSSKFAREYFAAFTTIFFAWLVGPCQVKESEFEGRREKNVVHIPKCRFLEETKCVGMCTNLCKMPSQVFIKESLGVPIHMVPNFDDMSCEMIFGEEPPPQSLDPAFTQPCYKQCKSIKRYQHKCTT